MPEYGVEVQLLSAAQVLPFLTGLYPECYHLVMSALASRYVKFLPLCVVAFLAIWVPTMSVLADSSRAYQDYLYQFDVYRTKYAEFKVAKNEYEKFRSLTSQTVALEKTGTMLSQRDLLLRAYLLLLGEKLNEDMGLGTADKGIYQTLINNEVGFLDTHSKLVQSIGNLEDAQEVSRGLESHYSLLQASMRQTIIGISLGKLTVLAHNFDTVLADAKALINTNRGSLSLQKQSTIDRWLLQITNTKSLYQQKIDGIVTANAQLKGNDIGEQDQIFAKLTRNIGEARQYLVEGTGFINELVEALRYQD